MATASTTSTADALLNFRNSARGKLAQAIVPKYAGCSDDVTYFYGAIVMMSEGEKKARGMFFLQVMPLGEMADWIQGPSCQKTAAGYALRPPTNTPKARAALPAAILGALQVNPGFRVPPARIEWFKRILVSTRNDIPEIIIAAGAEDGNTRKKQMRALMGLVGEFGVIPAFSKDHGVLSPPYLNVVSFAPGVPPALACQVDSAARFLTNAVCDVEALQMCSQRIGDKDAYNSLSARGFVFATKEICNDSLQQQLGDTQLDVCVPTRFSTFDPQTSDFGSTVKFSAEYMLVTKADDPHEMDVGCVRMVGTMWLPTAFGAFTTNRARPVQQTEAECADELLFLEHHFGRLSPALVLAHDYTPAKGGAYSPSQLPVKLIFATFDFADYLRVNGLLVLPQNRRVHDGGGALPQPSFLAGDTSATRCWGRNMEAANLPDFEDEDFYRLALNYPPDMQSIADSFETSPEWRVFSIPRAGTYSDKRSRSPVLVKDPAEDQDQDQDADLEPQDSVDEQERADAPLDSDGAVPGSGSSVAGPPRHPPPGSSKSQRKTKKARVGGQ